MFLSSVLHSNHPIHPSLESFHLKKKKNETSNESEVIEFSRQKFSLVFFLSQNIEMHKKSIRNCVQNYEEARPNRK